MYVGIILWKKKYLDFLIPSLVAQTEARLLVHLHDQSPNQEAFDYLHKNYPELKNDNRFVITHGSNRFHSGGHNFLINEFLKTRHRFYVCASLDMWYDPDFFESFGQKIKKQRMPIGVATVKSYHWDYENADLKDMSQSKTNTIDSCGLSVSRSWVFSDIGQGEEDSGQFNQRDRVFGASGALIAFDKAALKQVAFIDHEGGIAYFDPLIHYKNDVELAVRLNRSGVSCAFYPDISVWHDRQATTIGQAPGILAKIKYRNNKSRWERESSFYGQIVVFQKHLHASPFVSQLLARAHWLKVLIFITIFEPFLWKQYSVRSQNRSKIENHMSQHKDLQSLNFKSL